MGNANGSSELKKRKTDTDIAPLESKQRKVREETDVTRWRCMDDDGRLTWHYLEDEEDAKEWPQSYADKWYLGLDLVSSGHTS